MKGLLFQHVQVLSWQEVVCKLVGRDMSEEQGRRLLWLIPPAPARRTAGSERATLLARRERGAGEGVFRRVRPTSCMRRRRSRATEEEEAKHIDRIGDVQAAVII